MIEQSIEEKRYKGMYYYLKCREMFRSPNISADEIRDAHDIFFAPMNVEFQDVEVQPAEDEKSFAESVSSTNE